MKTATVRGKAQSASDAVIDGLMAGILAGVGMLGVIILMGLMVGLNPAEVLSKFGTGQNITPLTGALVHLAVSGIYGAVFGMLVYLLPMRFRERVPGWLTGLVYGSILLLVGLGFLLPGLASPLAALPW
jgi:hypothetical protein